MGDFQIEYRENRSLLKTAVFSFCQCVEGNA